MQMRPNLACIFGSMGPSLSLQSHHQLNGTLLVSAGVDFDYSAVDRKHHQWPSVIGGMTHSKWLLTIILWIKLILFELWNFYANLLSFSVPISRPRIGVAAEIALPSPPSRNSKYIFIISLVSVLVRKVLNSFTFVVYSKFLFENLRIHKRCLHLKLILYILMKRAIITN